MLGDRCSQGKKLWLQELWVLSGDDDKWSQNHVMTCEKDLYKTQNPCIRNTKTELSHTEWVLSLRLKLSLHEETASECSETRSMYIRFHRYVHYRSLSVTPVWLIATCGTSSTITWISLAVTWTTRETYNYIDLSAHVNGTWSWEW